MPRQLAQQRMTLIDLEWPLHARIARNISAYLSLFCFKSSIRISLEIWRTGTLRDRPGPRLQSLHG